MAEHPNAARVRALFAAFERADLATIQASIPADAVWHFPGRTGQLAGVHRGRDAVLQFLMRAAQLTGGTIHLELEDVLANDSQAVALFRGRATREGRRLDNPTCLRMRIEDGQIGEVWDLFAVDAFWT